MLRIRYVANLLKTYGSNKKKNERLVLQICNKASISADEKNALGEIGGKYQVFEDKDAEVILDMYEEKLKYQQLLEEETEQDDPFKGINLESKFI